MATKSYKRPYWKHHSPTLLVLEKSFISPRLEKVLYLHTKQQTWKTRNQDLPNTAMLVLNRRHCTSKLTLNMEKDKNIDQVTSLVYNLGVMN